MGHRSTFNHCQNVIANADSPIDRPVGYWKETARLLAVVLSDTTGYVRMERGEVIDTEQGRQA